VDELKSVVDLQLESQLVQLELELGLVVEDLEFWSVVGACL
jgi:hypothetical protein